MQIIEYFLGWPPLHLVIFAGALISSIVTFLYMNLQEKKSYRTSFLVAAGVSVMFFIAGVSMLAFANPS